MNFWFPLSVLAEEVVKYFGDMFPEGDVLCVPVSGNAVCPYEVVMRSVVVDDILIVVVTTSYSICHSFLLRVRCYESE